MAIAAVPLSRVAGPIVGVKDPSHNTHTLDSYYYFLNGRKSWAQHFIEEAQEFASDPDNASVDVNEMEQNRERESRREVRHREEQERQDKEEQAGVDSGSVEEEDEVEVLDDDSEESCDSSSESN